MRLLLAILFLVAACSPGGTSTATQASPASGGPSGSTRIEVKLTDGLKIEPGAMTVPAGVPVTFVVTNAGGTDHEFNLGDEAAQAAHEQEMGGMGHDEPSGVGLKPGETKELTFTFPAAGGTIAGCHVDGHYAAGMKAVITITG